MPATSLSFSSLEAAAAAAVVVEEEKDVEKNDVDCRLNFRLELAAE